MPSILDGLGLVATGINAAVGTGQHLNANRMAMEDRDRKRRFEDEDRAREQAVQAFKVAAEMGAKAHHVGDHAGAARWANQVHESLGTLVPGYQKPNPLVGAPINQPDLAAAPEAWKPNAAGNFYTAPAKEVGRDFSTAPTISALDGLYGPEPVTTFDHDPTKDLYKKKRGVIERIQKAVPKADPFTVGEGEVRYSADGKTVLARGGPKTYAPPRTEATAYQQWEMSYKPQQDYQEYLRKRSLDKAKYVQDAVQAFTSTNTRTVTDTEQRTDKDGKPFTIQGATRTVFPGLVQIEAARKQAETDFDRLNSLDPPPPAIPGAAPVGRDDPMAPVTSPGRPIPGGRPVPPPPVLPGGGAGAGGAGGSGGGGGFSVAPTTMKKPKKWEDTALLPEVEAAAQDLLATVPGMSISSRARSKERNDNAGGVTNSAHRSRQGFDVVGPRQNWGRVVEWARSRGLEALPEPNKNHIHIQVPASRRQHLEGRAPSPEQLADFYARNGIELGGGDGLA